MNKFYYVLILSVCLLASCSNKNEVYGTLEKQFKTSLDTVTGSNKIKAAVYMVIPRAGCGGCISTAEVFMIKCLQKPDDNKFIKFILTNFDSEKLLRARFGNFYKSGMLITDKNSVFAANNSLKSIYPVIYFFDSKGGLYQVNQCSPNEDGIAAISAYKKLKKDSKL